MSPKYIWALIGFLFFGCSPAPQSKTFLIGDDSRDLILVSIDTLRASRLSFYDSLYTSPRQNLEGEVEDDFTLAWLFNNGTVYSNVWASSGKTLPSLASFFTGLTPFEHGALSNTMRVLKPTMVVDWKNAGGRAHARVANRALHPFCGLKEGFDSYAVRAKANEPNLGRELVNAATPDIKESKRLLLWAHFMAPHQPYEPIEPYRTQSLVGPSILANNQSLMLAHKNPSAEEENFSAYRDLYDAEIATANQYMHEFFTLLDEQYRNAGRGGLLDNAIIVFFSDHGEELADRHGYFLHAKSLYRSVIQVPLVIVDKDKSFEVVKEDIALQEVLSHLLNGTPLSGGPFFATWHDQFFAMRDERFTFVHNPQSNIHGPIEPPKDVPYFYPDVALYDRLNDPFELSNIAAQNPEKVKEMGSALYEWYSQVNATPGESSDYLDPETLSELGYGGEIDVESLEEPGPWPPSRYE